MFQKMRKGLAIGLAASMLVGTAFRAASLRVVNAAELEAVDSEVYVEDTISEDEASERENMDVSEAEPESLEIDGSENKDDALEELDVEENEDNGDFIYTEENEEDILNSSYEDYSFEDNVEISEEISADNLEDIQEISDVEKLKTDNENEGETINGEDIIDESDLLETENEVVLKYHWGAARVLWGDDVFPSDPSISKKNLAILSGALSAAAEGKGKDEGKDYYISQAYKDLGFSDDNISLYSYPDSTYNRDGVKNADGKEFADDDNLAFSIAHKQIGLPSTGGTRYIVMITARGSTTNDEFMADATTGARRVFYNHRVYDIVYDFEEDIWAGIKDHFSRHKELEKGRLKFLVTGHSLGGAAANLVAARLTNYSDDIIAAKKDIYAYTFGAIDSLQKDEGQVEDGFENIFNIYNYLDTFGPVGEGVKLGVVPFTAAGHFIYNKFGKICLFTHDYGKGNTQNHNIENYIDAVEKGYVSFDKEDKESISDGGGDGKAYIISGSYNKKTEEASNQRDFRYKVRNNTEIEITKYLGDGDAVIPDSFVLEGVSYPVKKIGDYAFFNCSRLTSVTIPGSVTSIGAVAFSSCSKLTSVTIREGVTSIGGSAFSQCGELASVTIPGSVKSIGPSAFFACSNLEGITIQEGVTSIGKSAFHGCNSLKSVVIPGSVTSIGESVFSQCSSLTSVTIREGVTDIGRYAFSKCSSLSSVRIPPSVTSIGAGVFSGCSSLKDLYYSGSRDQWNRIDGIESIIKSLNKNNVTVHFGVGGESSSFAVTGVTLSSGKINMVSGKSITLTAVVKPSDASDKRVTWRSSNSKVATVSSKGVVKSIDAGIAIITVTTKDGKKTAKCIVTVTNPIVKVKTVKLNKKTASIKKGKTVTLKTTISPSNATNRSVTWKSSNKKIATVTNKGVVKGVKKGTATITVTTKDGNKTVKCIVTVK